MAKGEELIKFITQRVVTYIDTPKEERKKTNITPKEPWQYRWFGMIPMSLTITKERTKEIIKRRKETPPQ